MGHVGERLFAGAFIATHLLGVLAVQVRTEGGHLDHLVVAAPAMHHVHDAKTPANDEGAAKTGFHFLGRGVGGHIKVFRLQADQQIAHCAAHDVSLKAALLQGAHHVQGAFVHQLVVDAVFLFADDAAFAKAGFGRNGCFAQQAVNYFFNHGVSKRSRIRQPRSRAV